MHILFFSNFFAKQKVWALRKIRRGGGVGGLREFGKQVFCMEGKEGGQLKKDFASQKGEGGSRPL